MTKDKKNDQAQPKIIVDDDWKARAQAEKEKLTEEQKAQKSAQRPPLPPPSFTLLVISLVTQIRICFGDIEDPGSGKKTLDLDVAKHNIDMLEMLDEKTRGNLTEQEKQLLDSVLYEVRMRYVQLS